jgi:hypothetical protein
MGIVMGKSFTLSYTDRGDTHRLEEVFLACLAGAIADERLFLKFIM